MVHGHIVSHNQMFIPDEIRLALKLKEGDRIVYEIRQDNTAVMRKMTGVDVPYLESIQSTLTEWESSEDDVAYRDL